MNSPDVGSTIADSTSPVPRIKFGYNSSQIRLDRRSSLPSAREPDASLADPDLSLRMLGDGSRHIIFPSCEVIDHRGDDELDKLEQVLTLPICVVS